MFSATISINRELEIFYAKISHSEKTIEEFLNDVKYAKTEFKERNETFCGELEDEMLMVVFEELGYSTEIITPDFSFTFK
jgi:hypothetical protein